MTKEESQRRTGLCEERFQQVLSRLLGHGLDLGLAGLHILRGVMVQLNAERQRAGLPSTRPWELFDLIGGTREGGYAYPDGQGQGFVASFYLLG